MNYNFENTYFAGPHLYKFDKTTKTDVIIIIHTQVRDRLGICIHWIIYLLSKRPYFNSFTPITPTTFFTIPGFYTGKLSGTDIYEDEKTEMSSPLVSAYENQECSISMQGLRKCSQ